MFTRHSMAKYQSSYILVFHGDIIRAQQYTNPGRQVARETRLGNVTLNICVSSVWCLFCAALLVPRNLRWILGFETPVLPCLCFKNRSLFGPLQEQHFFIVCLHTFIHSHTLFLLSFILIYFVFPISVLFCSYLFCVLICFAFSYFVLFWFVLFYVYLFCFTCICFILFLFVLF